MSQKVFEIVARVMGVAANSIDIESSPQTIGSWDSLRHMKLILAIEEALDVQFTDEDLVSINNVRELIARIEARKP